MIAKQRSGLLLSIYVNQRMTKKNSNKKLDPYLNSAIRQRNYKPGSPDSAGSALLSKMERTDLPGMIQFLHDSSLAHRPEVNHPLVDFAVLACHRQPLRIGGDCQFRAAAHRATRQLNERARHRII